MNHDGLFRQEALANKRQDEYLESVSLISPLPFKILTITAIALTAVLVFFFISGHYTVREMVEGKLLPSIDPLTVRAQYHGTISKILVEEGDIVELGQPLAKIDPAAAAKSEANRLTNHGKIQIDTDLMIARRSALESLRKVIDTQLSIQRRQIAAAQTLISETTALVEKGAIPDVRLKELRDIALKANLVEKILTKKKLDINRELRTRDKDAHRQTKLPHVLKAQTSGVVTSIVAISGQLVTRGQPLLYVRPRHSVLQAQLLVPANAIGFVKKGDSINLRYPAFPSRKYGNHRGKVASISSRALTPPEVSAFTHKPSVTPLKQAVYRVVVSLETKNVNAYGHIVPLKPGMKVKAEIPLERRKLIKWP